MNIARCKNCGDVIQSRHRHDWVCCSCFNGKHGIFVDGGEDYYRRGGNMDDFEEVEAGKEKKK